MPKSQAALEFLTTYAWVFVMITMTIGAMYYFGLFDFGKVPERCTFPSQFECLDYRLRDWPGHPNEGAINLRLQNNLGEDVVITSLFVTDGSNPPMQCLYQNSTPFTATNKEEIELIFDSCNGGTFLYGADTALYVTFTYYAINSPSQTVHTINGKVEGEVQTV